MTEPQQSGTGPNGPNPMLKVGYGFAMATQFGASVLAGVWLGGWIERRYSLAPWGTLGGALVGMAAGIHGLMILVRSMRSLGDR
ncbi:MAG: AtpZ/AtpI family protein [Deltaproteobacteria bacterium]|nr:AtpZ/AtpI family protein [Deltaproteobacteria bacterium]